MTNLKVQCCVCNKLRDENGVWIYHPIKEKVSHTYCPEHLNEIKEQLKKRSKS